MGTQEERERDRKQEQPEAPEQRLRRVQLALSLLLAMTGAAAVTVAVVVVADSVEAFSASAEFTTLLAGVGSAFLSLAGAILGAIAATRSRRLLDSQRAGSQSSSSSTTHDVAVVVSHPPMPDAGTTRPAPSEIVLESLESSSSTYRIYAAITLVLLLATGTIGIALFFAAPLGPEAAERPEVLPALLAQTITIRVGIAALLVYLVRILTSLSRYCLSMAGQYQGQASAIRLAFHLKGDEVTPEYLSSLLSALQPTVRFEEAKAPYDELLRLVKPEKGDKRKNAGDGGSETG